MKQSMSKRIIKKSYLDELLQSIMETRPNQDTNLVWIVENKVQHHQLRFLKDIHLGGQVCCHSL